VGDAGASAKYDVERMVAMDGPAGGTQTLPLRFNISDDPSSVAKEFMTTHGLPPHNFDQVRVLTLGSAVCTCVPVRKRVHEAHAHGCACLGV
jgi:hypothetical protein